MSPVLSGVVCGRGATTTKNSYKRRYLVQLFNAVSKQQKITDKKTKEAGSSERKRSKVLNSIDKGSFIDMLKAGGGDGDGKTKKAKKLTSERDNSIPLRPANWDVLKDGYMKRSASMLDWEEEGEGDSSSLGDSPSSDSPNEEEYT